MGNQGRGQVGAGAERAAGGVWVGRAGSEGRAAARAAEARRGRRRQRTRSGPGGEALEGVLRDTDTHTLSRSLPPLLSLFSHRRGGGQRRQHDGAKNDELPVINEGSIDVDPVSDGPK